MKIIKQLTVAYALVALGAGVLPVQGVGYTFSRYQVILDREPFGAAPEPPSEEDLAATRMAAEPPAFLRTLRMCAITETEDFGLRVGLVDINAKPPVSYLLSVGEVEDGIEVVDADFDREGALLKKNGEMYWIYLDGSTGGGPGGAQRGGAAASPTASLAPVRPRLPNTDAGSTFRASYAERLKKRREILEARRRAADQRADVGPEALKEQLKEYQMELIRAGGELGPPLPIPLTKEMDDQLVAEGVLPPPE